MKLIENLKSMFTTKASVTNKLVTLFLHSGTNAPKDQRELDLAKEGYNQTGVVYACVREISVAFAGIKWGLFRNHGAEKEEILEHPLLRLWNRPNREQGSSAFLQAVASHYLISGNTYIEAARDSAGVPQYLYCLRPDRMTVIPDAIERIGGYKYSVGGQAVSFIDGEVLHFKDFHPSNDWYGLSPISVAALSVDSYKGQQRWNRNLIENSARPSGIITYEDDLSPEAVNNIKEEFAEKFAGAENSNRPLVLEGGKMKWEQMAFNAKELDFIASQNLSALQISQIYNMPPELIGLSPATYQNRKEARKALYTEVVLPMLDRFRDDFNNWLPEMFGAEDLSFEPNFDDIESLQEDREKLWSRLDASDELTLNEKRIAKGYDAVDEGDVIFISTGKIPLDDALDPFGGLPTTEETENDETESDQEAIEEADEEAWNDSFGSQKEDEETFGEGTQDPVEGTKQSGEFRKEILSIGRMRKRFSRKIGKDVRNLFDRESARVMEAIDRFGFDSPSNIEDAIDQSKDDWEALFFNNRLRIMKAFGERAVRNFKSDNPDIETKASQQDIFIQQIRIAAKLHVAELITNVSATTKAKVRKIIGDGTATGKPVEEMARDIRNGYKGFSKGRSDTIALTETVTAQNRGSLEAMNSLKIPLHKVWVWSGITGEHERRGHRRADGQAVQQADYFSVSPDGDSFENLLHPGDPMASASNRINCHCGLIYRRDRQRDKR